MPQPEDPEDAGDHHVAPAANRVRAGTLLIANIELLEPTFRRSVIYVVEHNDGGTLGVVLNRPSETAVYNVLPNEYLARVHWRPGGALVVSVLDRPQQRLTLVAFEPATWERTVLLEEEGHPWLNLDHDLRFLEDGSFIRSSERPWWE